MVEPDLGEHLQGSDLDPTARRELRTLSKDNADGVARHLLATDEAVTQDDLDKALAHARSAVRRAGRVAVVREVLGVVHYRRGEWAKALSEFRTARRLSGSEHLLPLMADAERGLGRPERALELAHGPGARQLSGADRAELTIVEAGARRDLGQGEAATHLLRQLAERTKATVPWAARVWYAYADSLLADGLPQGAREWFERAAGSDSSGQTDAGQRLADLDGLRVVDLEPPDTGDPAAGAEASRGVDTGP